MACLIFTTSLLAHGIKHTAYVEYYDSGNYTFFIKNSKKLFGIDKCEIFFKTTNIYEKEKEGWKKK